jgi:hypothetical protein
MSLPIHRLLAWAAVLPALAAGLPSGTAGDKPAADLGTVEGKISYQGKPLPGGTVSFHPAKGKPFVGAIQPDGTYRIKDVPAGQYRVAIETASAKPKVKPPVKDKDNDTKVEPPKDAERYVPIPEKYGDPNLSPLMVEVQKGKNFFNIELR